MSLKSLVVYHGHHKCASSWFRRIFEDVGRWIGCNTTGFDNPRQFDHDLPAYIQKHQLEFVSFTNAERKHTESLGEHRGVHIIRDPRDVLISSYFSHRYSHPTEHWPELVPHREKLESLDEEKGLLAELEFSECYLRQMYEWNYQTPGVLEITFEQLTTTPYETNFRIFEHLGVVRDEDCKPAYRLRDFSRVCNLSIKRRLGGKWPLPLRTESIPSHQLAILIHQQRYKKLAGGRKQGQSNKKSHYRKGKAGDWVNYFTPEIQAAFDERYPQFLSLLGYS